MKKIIQTGIYTIYPSLTFAVFMLAILGLSQSDAFFVFLILVYFFPIFGFYYFIKKRPFNQWLLPVGFALVPLLAVIYEYNRAAGQLVTYEIIFIYAFPYFVISLIIAFALSSKDEWKTVKKQELIIISALLFFIYSFSGVPFPFAHRNTFRMVVSEIPQNMSVGDELTVTARVKNRSARFFYISYTFSPIMIFIDREGGSFYIPQPYNSRVLLPFSSLKAEVTYVFSESGEYTIAILSRFSAYESFQTIYITVE